MSKPDSPIATERLQATISLQLSRRLDAAADRDHPGAPNRSATIARLLALGLDTEDRWRGDDFPPARPTHPLPPRQAVPEPTSNPVTFDLAAAQAQLRRRRAEAGLDPDTGRPPALPKVDAVGLVMSGELDPGAEPEREEESEALARELTSTLGGR